jgi:hypothetical protein
MKKREALDALRQDREKLLNRPKNHSMFSPGVDEHKAVVEEGHRWGTYGSGAHGNDGYFASGKDSFANLVSFKEAEENIAKIKGNKKAIVLDVMGTGKIGVDLGADIAIGWTYKDHSEEERALNQTVRAGDLFQDVVVHDHLEHLDQQIKREDAVLTAVFFRAVGGYAVYKENLYANAILYEKYLRPLYQSAPIGAHFYLNINFNESYGQQLLQTLKKQGYKIMHQRDPNDIQSLFCAVLVKTKEKDTLPPARSFVDDLDVLQEKK